MAIDNEISLEAIYHMPGYLFRRATQIIAALFAEEFSDYNVTLVQFAAMLIIRNHPGVDATRLSALISYDSSTLGGALERLESKGLIVRKPTDEDKRIRRLFLSKEGIKLLKEMKPAFRRVQSRLIEKLEPSDRSALADILWKLVDNHTGIGANLVQDADWSAGEKAGVFKRPRVNRRRAFRSNQSVGKR